MKLEEYKKALSAAALGEEQERLAAAVVKKLEKKRQKKRIVRRVLVPVFSAAVLCIVAVPLLFPKKTLPKRPKRRKRFPASMKGTACGFA